MRSPLWPVVAMCMAMHFPEKCLVCSYITELRALPPNELVRGADALRIDDFLADLERSGGTGEIDLTVVGSGGYCFGVYLKLSQASFYGQNTCRIIATARKHASAPLHIPANRCDALTSLISHQHFLETLATSI